MTTEQPPDPGLGERLRALAEGDPLFSVYDTGFVSAVEEPGIDHTLVPRIAQGPMTTELDGVGLPVQQEGAMIYEALARSLGPIDPGTRRVHRSGAGLVALMKRSKHSRRFV